MTTDEYIDLIIFAVGKGSMDKVEAYDRIAKMREDKYKFNLHKELLKNKPRKKNNDEYHDLFIKHGHE